ncbi:hypothetical protein MKX03_023971 [Papaver bracteatum]|nr:hypothetical protein MKX03_023971 [Papaver bracteatum]
MATERAQQYQLSLGGAVHSFVMSMRPSHVSRGFWLGLPHGFCEDHLPQPNHDASTIRITLVDLQGVQFEIRYIPKRHGLSRGWRQFVLEHNLIHGDALVFELTEPTVFKVSDNIDFNLYVSTS